MNDKNAKKPNSTIGKIDLLENQIHAINIKLNSPEEKNWWKRNTSLIISIVALTASLCFSFYGVTRAKTKDKEEKVKGEKVNKANKIAEIERLTLKLTDLAEKYIKLPGENPNININQVSVLYNYQRLIYVHEIIALMKEVDEPFAPDVYALIGNELRNDGQYLEALNYYKLEWKNAKTPASKVVACRDLGAVYGIFETEIFNIDSSLFYWRKSIKEADKISGELKYSYKGYSYQLWANHQLYHGNHKFALSLIDSARNEYQKLPNNNSMKTVNLNALNQILINEERIELTKTFANLAGEWNGTIKDGDKKIKVHFYQNPNGWFSNLEMYQSKKMIASFSGMMVSISKNHITFSLQGISVLIGNPFPKQATASLKLTQYKTQNNVLHLTLNEFNSDVIKTNIYK